MLSANENLMVWLICALGVLIVSGTMIASLYYALIQSVKKEIKVQPRVPMHVCDKHGAYPAKYTIPIVVPQEGRADLIVEQCVFCWDAKMKLAEKILKSQT